jgi:sugar/nucleoside kinase (ribokinase family)
MAPSNILVIGCASTDTIHLENGVGKTTHSTIGGAGLFTALAAARGGAAVTLYAPKPKTMSADLARLASYFHWIGPEIEAVDMPRLEIVHHGQDRATLLDASWGAESLLTPANFSQMAGIEDGPDQKFDLVHIAALSTVARQIEFAAYFAGRRASGTDANLLISAGTYARAISGAAEAVAHLQTICDLFFMNANEAQLLFGNANPPLRSDQLCFITDGARGATIFLTSASDAFQTISIAAIQCLSAQNMPGHEPLDPTGAGDSFCGATIAAIGAALTENLADFSWSERKALLAEAGRSGASLASAVIGYPGSNYYLITRR